MAEYTGIDVGLATTVGHDDITVAFTHDNRPFLKPIFTSAIIETELIETLFFVVNLGVGSLWQQKGGETDTDDVEQTSPLAGATDACVATIWSKFGNDWLKFHIGTGLAKGETSVVAITPNTPGSQVLEQSTLLLSGSLTPVIGSRTYLTIEPQISSLEQTLVNGLPTYTGGENPEDSWDWIDGTAIAPGDENKFYGYQVINSIHAYLKNPS
jgi:hypothetical protein